ncbi:MAG: hypothetical protein Q7I97_02745 [Thermovirgaceae bacterium]|nr:hypothetical protein [Thermovirgaceae bacterium]
MRLRGRGVVVGGELMPWYFDLEESGGKLLGELRVEGWEPAGVMNAWYESAKRRKIDVVLQGAGKAVLKAGGIRIHESGHHNETSISVKGSLLSA